MVPEQAKNKIANKMHCDTCDKSIKIYYRKIFIATLHTNIVHPVHTLPLYVLKVEALTKLLNT